MRPIGMHIRLKKGLNDVLHAVNDLHIDVVQSFLFTEANEYVFLSDRLTHDFVHEKSNKNFLYFVHAAYWSGLSDRKSKMFASLQQEISVAQELQSDGIVIHVGAGKTGMSQKDKALYVAECVNELSSKYSSIPLLLENSPHAGRNFGGDFTDFAVLMNHVEKKDQVRFCVDTAHAFVFGYDIAKENVLSDFLILVEESLGKNRIALLHFNDAADKCGSYIDKHEIPGKGLIGTKSLENCMNSSVFKDVPIIMEMSSSCEEPYSSIIHKINSWEK